MPLCSDEEFIKIFQDHGANEAAKIIGCTVRSIYARRVNIEAAHGIRLTSPNAAEGQNQFRSQYPKRIAETVKNGVIIVGSDAHYWPGIISPAHRALVKITKELKPVLSILNGDVSDGVQNSRHARIGWSKGPKVREEIEVVEERTEEIRLASPKSKRIWLLGNHDFRFESKLADRAPEYEGVHGTALADHFPHWSIGVSLWINDEIVIKHRFKGGVHATHNNTLTAGKTMVTGHLHSLKVTPYSDYNGTRFGIDTGTLADPYGPQFEYAEDNPLNHRSGFIVLTIKDGLLLWPEVCRVIDEDHVEFRGQVIKV